MKISYNKDLQIQKVEGTILEKIKFYFGVWFK